MFGSTLARRRRYLAMASLPVLGLMVVWFFSPGLPVLWGPSASAEERAAGRALFVRDWEPGDSQAGGDGLGPVFNASSCVACHFQGGIGGSGPSQRNVTSFEVLPTRAHPEIRGGILHAFAVEPALRESQEMIRQFFPIFQGGTRVVDGCTIQVPDFDPLRTTTVNSTALFGAGWIDRISERAIKHQLTRQTLTSTARELEFDFSSVGRGRPRYLAGGRIGKFGWKAQFATLEEFVAAACANELGLGNPLMEQARPLANREYPGSKPDLNRKQFKALVAFVDTLPRPEEVLSTDSSQRGLAVRGKDLFGTIGCIACHVPDLNGVKGVYSDFLLHDLGTTTTSGPYESYANAPVPVPDTHPLPGEWKTPPLWGVADSAPYFHDGSADTLEDAVLRHAGGAANVTRRYKALSPADQGAVIAFLKTLRAPQEP
jgi:mono/diheme cytochrome c family protein